MSIPGIPGVSEPHFRTRDCRWMGLDTLVLETCKELEAEGESVSPHAVKATIQIARMVVQEPIERETDQLIALVASRLRTQKVLVGEDLVRLVLTTYARIIAVLDILEINELG
ncbi:MAG: hypothetical protein CL930_04505 [Deltaproteobacteria bacterium]|nr:hypothetical protein [Deltaproteobacteria bacterium]